jgi:hypothetical protein
MSFVRLAALASALWLWLCFCLASLAADPVVVRVKLEPKENVVIGQRVRLLVDVLFPGEMPYPPRVAAPKVSGAQVFRFESQATTISDQIGGVTYAGQRFEFALYPRRGGELAVPAVTATLLDRAQNETGTASAPATRLRVAVPPGVDASQPVIAAAQATMTEQDGAPTGRQVQIGDAWRRAIERRAEDVPGLAMPAFDFVAPAGVRVYADPPQINDKSERGSLTGERIDQVTYQFETAGTFVIPALTQTWWDLNTKAARTITLPARTVHVAEAQTAQPVPGWHWGIPCVLAGIAVLAGLAVGVRPAYARYAAWRQHRELSEPAVFRRLLRACKTGQAGLTYQTLARWNQVFHENGNTQKRVADALAEAGATILLARLSASLFATQTSRPGWREADGRQLAYSLRTARRHLQDHRRQSRPLLPPLNPTTQVPSELADARLQRRHDTAALAGD